MEKTAENFGPVMVEQGLSTERSAYASKIMSQGDLSGSIVKLAKDRKDKDVSFYKWLADFFRRLMDRIFGRESQDRLVQLNSEAKDAADKFYAAHRLSLKGLLKNEIEQHAAEKANPQSARTITPPPITPSTMYGALAGGGGGSPGGNQANTKERKSGGGSGQDGPTEGILIEHKADFYQHKVPEWKNGKLEEMSYYVKIRKDDGQITTLWGVDLKEIMAFQGPEIGSKIRLTLMGKETVLKPVKVPTKDKKSYTVVNKYVEKNDWRLDLLDGKQAPKPSTRRGP